MKKILLIISLLLASCTVTKYVPVETIKEVSITNQVRDTVIIYKPSKDSISIQTKDTISHLETSLAVSEASISDGLLKHSIKNKDSLKVKIEYKDRIVEKIVKKEVPVEVVREVYKTPKWCWYLLGLNVILLLGLIIKLVIKWKLF